MKKINVLIFAAVIFTAVSCGKKKQDEIPSPSNTSAVELSGDLSTMTLDNSKVYLLKDKVFVRSGNTLTIPAGTVIMGDAATKAALIIDQGGKIMAEGTASSPIVFTSEKAVGERDRGDWAGIVIVGKANSNTAGHTVEGLSPALDYTTNTVDNADNSGVLKYVRIEYAGIALQPNQELNSLSLYRVGSGTTIENVQVSYGGDDGFEWFGGSVNCKNLVSFATWDDDFDSDYGFTGNVQYGLVIRDPFGADQSGSNGIESDNDPSGSLAVTPNTTAKFANITIFGPLYDSTKTCSGNYNYAMHLKKNTKASVYNTVVIGYPKLVFMDGNAANYDNSNVVVQGNVLINLLKYNKTSNTTTFGTATQTAWETGNGTANTKVVGSTANFQTEINTYLGTGASSLLWGNNNNYPNVSPNFATTLGTAATTGVSLPVEFTFSSYSGAFNGTDWTDGWVNFDPLNTVY